MKRILGLDLGTNSIGWALVEEAENKASALQKRSIQEGKEEVLAFKREQEQTLKERKIELAAQENKVNQREQNIDRRDAALIEREKQIKSWNRKRKNELVESMNPKWMDLYDSIL